jgi:hypothetical protein
VLRIVLTPLLLEKPQSYEGNSAVPVALPRAALAIRDRRPPWNLLQWRGSIFVRLKDDLSHQGWSGRGALGCPNAARRPSGDWAGSATARSAMRNDIVNIRAHIATLEARIEIIEESGSRH